MTGFEPVTFCTQNKRATKLRYIPTIGLQCHCIEFLFCFPHRYFLHLYIQFTIYMGISSFWSHLTYNNSKRKVLYTYEIRNGTCRKNK